MHMLSLGKNRARLVVPVCAREILIKGKFIAVRFACLRPGSRATEEGEEEDSSARE